MSRVEPHPAQTVEEAVEAVCAWWAKAKALAAAGDEVGLRAELHLACAGHGLPSPLLLALAIVLTRRPSS